MMVAPMLRLDSLLKGTHRRDLEPCDGRPTKRARTITYKVSDSPRRPKSSLDQDSSPVEHLGRVLLTRNHHQNLSAHSFRPTKPLPRHPTSSASSAESSRPPPPPQYSGLFDLFSSVSSSIPASLFGTPDKHGAFRSLHKIFSDIQSSLHFEEGQCFLSTCSETPTRHGSLHWSTIRDPLDNRRLNISLHDIREVSLSSGCKSSDVDMESSQSPPTAFLTSPEGLFASAQVVGGEGSGEDLVDSFGEFVIRRAWCGFSEDNDALMEIFEGHFTLQIFFGESYADLGLADAINQRLDFWAMRRKLDAHGVRM
ncbi:hypothetical protein D9757_007624 [Collybiopsis confluens]|uniref:Uncharacterized protein n=1 Tax=Collybiopsis confluens TaxID=2823264 RepID=A0A8H5H9M7_9AGAR|nr:hypothetical protein D9757_007624 [Collybiopsis confluens]